jgi:hypothetical protein
MRFRILSRAKRLNGEHGVATHTDTKADGQSLPEWPAVKVVAS